MSASSSATNILIAGFELVPLVLMCLESDSNRHYAVFETALSTVGVPRLSLKANLNGKPGLRHPRHRPRDERASHWLIQEFQAVNRRR